MTDINIPQSIFLVFLPVASVALFTFVAVAAWSDSRRREREAYYRSELIKKIAETQASGGAVALEFFREEERLLSRRTREGQKVGGLVTVAVGIGLSLFLRAVTNEKPVYMVGLIPLLIGVALLVYVYLLAPKET